MDQHHGMMGENGEPLHEPAAPDPPFDYLRNPLLPQGAGLAGIAVAALWLLGKLWQTHWLLGLVSLPVLGLVALLATWAAAIHLTGGEKFDDHPWV